MVAPAGILAAGASVPALRLAAADVAAAWGRSGGRSSAAVCAPDEDTLTLAWEAASAALRTAGLPAEAVDGLWWATTRPPFAEGPSHSVLASAVGLRPEAGGALLSGSPHCGIDALVAAWHAVAAGAAGVALVVASDALVPALGSTAEPITGAAGVAFVLTRDAAAAPVRLARSVTSSRPVLDRYRGDGEGGTRDAYDPRVFREEILLPDVRTVAARLDQPPDRWVVPDPDGRLGRAAAKVVGGEVADAGVTTALGDCGAAAPLLALATVLGPGAPAGSVAVIGAGGGRASAVVVEAAAPLPGAPDPTELAARGRTTSYAAVLRARRQLQPAGETIPMGVPPGSAMFVRGTAEVLQLHGARCADCGTIATPPSVHPACPSCGGPKLEDVALSRHGEVVTFVVNHTMPPPFEAPLGLAVVDLADGARLMVQTVGDGSDLAIGAEVELVLRRYAIERGVPVYGHKARVVTGGRS